MKQITKRRVWLSCGILSPLLYLITDLIAGHLYPNYSFSGQAVSELFAIGAPTSRLVVSLFTVSSLLLAAFALGIYRSSANSRALRALGIFVFANAINSIILWIFFPMHMRGDQTTLTDVMHTILAINPFIHVSIILGIIAYKNWLRFYSIITMALLIIPAVVSFSNVSLLLAHQPTPWMGLTERIAVYGHQSWHAVLSIALILGIYPSRSKMPPENSISLKEQS